MVNSNDVANKNVVNTGMPEADAPNPGEGKKRKRSGGLKINQKDATPQKVTEQDGGAD